MLALAALAAVAAATDLEQQKFVDLINAKQNLWKAAVNSRNSSMFKRSLGAKLLPREKFHTLGNVIKASPGFSPPESFDAAVNWPRCAEVINDIRDQSACGCCWAFGAAEAASDRMCIATNGATMIPLSAQDLCFCSNTDGCGGGYLSTAWQYIYQSGIVTGGQYRNTGPFGAGFCSDFSLPHCHHHGPTRNDPYPDEGTPGCPIATSPACPTSCDATAVAPHNNFANDAYSYTTNSGSPIATYADVAAIQEAIMTNGPVECAFTVYSDFENYVSGVYVQTSGEPLGGHAVKMVGWGVDNSTGTPVPFWKIANSWNPYWGERGFFRIIRGQDECGIEDNVMSSPPDAVWGLQSRK